MNKVSEKSWIDRSFTRPALQNPNEHITAPEDAMQIDLVPELTPSDGYENIVTAWTCFPAVHLRTRHLIKTQIKNNC